MIYDKDSRPLIPIPEEYISWQKNGFKGIIHKNLKQVLSELDPGDLESESGLESYKRKRNLFYTFRDPVKIRDRSFQIMIKKTRPDTLPKKLSSLIRKSKAERSFNSAVHLLEHGLDTPFPLGWLVFRKSGFIIASLLITEKIPVFTKVRKLVKKNQEQDPFLTDLVSKVVRYIRKMHDSGMVHMDLNLANFLLTESDSDQRLVLIDLNRSRIMNQIPAFLRIRDIGRQHWKKYRSTFFELYCHRDEKLLKYRWYFDLYGRWRGWRKRIRKKT